MTFFIKIKNQSESSYGTQMTMNSQSNSEKKSNAGDITIPELKLYYRAKTIKTVLYLHKTDTKTNGKNRRHRHKSM
jgi:hypothetical protein